MSCNSKSWRILNFNFFRIPESVTPVLPHRYLLILHYPASIRYLPLVWLLASAVKFLCNTNWHFYSLISGNLMAFYHGEISTLKLQITPQLSPADMSSIRYLPLVWLLASAVKFLCNTNWHFYSLISGDLMAFYHGEISTVNTFPSPRQFTSDVTFLLSLFCPRAAIDRSGRYMATSGLDSTVKSGI